jgi:hypothetical protein
MASQMFLLEMKHLTSNDKPTKRAVSARVPHGVKDTLVVAVYPGGMIGLRELGRRKEYTLEVGTLYVSAIRAEIRAKKRR